ncbi:hypothetical protein EDD11_006923 [Mortierella claussenii]|nr:hypothetical protein EDD11_006923 [Mortierella claussenii]
MHPYLFFYLLGGVTLIPLTVVLTIAVLWIRLPRLDPTQPRPADLPPQLLHDSIQKQPTSRGNGALDTQGLSTPGTTASTPISSDNNTSARSTPSLRKRKGAKAAYKKRSESEYPNTSPNALSSSISVSATTTGVTTASAPALLSGSPQDGPTEDDVLMTQDRNVGDRQTDHHDDQQDRQRDTYQGDDDDDDDDNEEEDEADDDAGTAAEVETPATLSLKALAGREPDVLMQSDPNLNREGYVRMTRVPRLGPAAESISDYMTNMLFQPKNARPKDSYYAVLRYDTLFLYESDQQRDCKAVVPMTMYEVKIFPKNLPDNEIFNKEHPILIKRKLDAPASTSHLDNGQDEYYIFIHTPVIKEDWWLALLYASKLRKPGTKQKIQDKAQFDPEAIQNHIRILHSGKHHEHTRWFNSFLGRIFLGVYKTKKIQEIFIQKITRKTLKLKRPSFLGEIKVRSFDVGHSIPYITRTKLHELAMDGELSAEFHLDYKGGVRVEIEVDVGLGLATLKPVKVTVVLAVLVKAVSGMMTLKIKTPPTNRFWVGFQEPPEMDIVIEPIVADKAIKLNMVLTAIETKIREAMVEAIVLPNMDDTPFFNSNGTGGIFEGDEEITDEPVEDSDADSAKTEKTGKSGKNSTTKSFTRGKRRGSESSFGSEHAPPHIPALTAEREQSWTSTGTESDADPESAPIASTPPVTGLYLNHQHNNSSSSASTMSASSIASKFKRFSQAHFSKSGSSAPDVVADPSKLNTKPTVATSIATAIRTSPSATSHSASSTVSATSLNSSKLQAVIPKLTALSDASAEEPHGSWLSASSLSNGPSKKTSTSSPRRLAGLESPASGGGDSDGTDDVISPTGHDPLYQSLLSPIDQDHSISGNRQESLDGIKLSGTVPRSANLHKWGTAPADDSKGGRALSGTKTENDLHRRGSLSSSSSSHVGIAGILEGHSGSQRSGGGNSISQVQGNLANLFNIDKKSKRNQVRDDSGAHDSNIEDSQERAESATQENSSSFSAKRGFKDRDYGRKNSGDSLLNLKLKKDNLLKKITSRSSDEGQEMGAGSVSGTSSPSKFSLDNVSTLLSNRRRGSVSSSKGSITPTTTTSKSVPIIQEPHGMDSAEGTDQQVKGLRRLSARASAALTPQSESGHREVDHYPLDEDDRASIADSVTTNASTTSSKSAYIQQRSQAALGSAKAWVKRSLEERRQSVQHEDDPLLSGKMQMD